MAVSNFLTAINIFFSDEKIIFQVWFLKDGLRMVIQKKVGVKEKEAYARRLEVGLVNFDFLPTGVSYPVKMAPLLNFQYRVFN